MKYSKKITAFILILAMSLLPAGCGASAPSEQAADTTSDGAETQDTLNEPDTSDSKGDNVLYVAASFAYPSLDVHKEYYGWYTSIYGISEALFTLDENSQAVPCLAADATADGTKWTVTLNEDAAFSNGKPLTAQIAIDNIKRVAEVNGRFDIFGTFSYEAPDEHTVVIDTGDEVYPTLKSDLASPEFGMIDLDDTTDPDNAPICTGPFVIKEFNPEGDVTVSRNENYWGGDVSLDGAVFYYMQEDDPKLLAMQSGEIDCYNSVSSAALAVYETEPDKYKVTSVAGTRLQFYILNENRLDAAVREAINLTVDKEAIASYLEGTVSAANAPFPDRAAYAKVDIPPVDTKKAVELLENDGYVKNAEGIYEKNGEPLRINIAYYAARSLDTLALLIQEQLKAVGIDSYLTVEEDPDSTYIATADFDLALYCMISDKCGDPLYFIDSTLADGAYFNVGGFESAECQELIEALRVEVDAAERAALANRTIQIAVDDNAFGYVGLFNHTTVMKPNVSGFAEYIPFDFYGIGAATTK